MVQSKISIITVVYNGAKFLEKTILSVVNQNYGNLEYVIIDGGSTDGTIDIIKKYEDKIDFWISEKDKGIYDAMNKGINNASGCWIGFINSGDFYEQNIFDKIDNIISDFNDIEIIHGANTYIDVNGNVIHKHCPDEIPYSIISHPSTFTKKAVFQKVGCYRTDFKIASDLYFYLISAKKAKKKFIKANVSYMQNDGVSSNFNMNSAKEFYTLYRDCQFSLITSLNRAYVKPFVKNLIFFIFGEKVMNSIRKKIKKDYQ